MKIGFFRSIMGFGLLLVLVGCEAPSQPEETLEQRVEARWQYLIERDFESAWAYYTPGFRETTPADEFERYMARRPVRWLGAEVLDKNCEPQVCTVQVRMSYQAAGAPSGLSQMDLERVVEDTWVLLNGTWWFSED